jgi:hypothetical protein
VFHELREGNAAIKGFRGKRLSRSGNGAGMVRGGTEPSGVPSTSSYYTRRVVAAFDKTFKNISHLTHFYLFLERLD